MDKWKQIKKISGRVKVYLKNNKHFFTKSVEYFKNNQILIIPTNFCNTKLKYTKITYKINLTRKSNNNLFYML